MTRSSNQLQQNK